VNWYLIFVEKKCILINTAEIYFPGLIRLESEND